MPTSGLLNIYGKPKVGKTFAALQFSISISTNQPEVLGLPILTHGPVCYLQVDTPRGLFCTNYLEKIATGFDISNILIADQDIIPYPFNILGEGGAWLRQALQQLSPPPVALVVDTIRDVHSGDENDSAVMRNVMTALIASTKVVSPSPGIIFLSHSRKASTNTAEADEDIMETNRGSGAVAGRVDGVLRVGTTKKGYGTIYYKSRTAEDTSIRVTRDQYGFWKTTTSDDFILIRQAVAAHPEFSKNSLAKHLLEFSGYGSISTWIRRIDQCLDDQ